MSRLHVYHSLALGVALKVAAATAVVGALLFGAIYQGLAHQGRSALLGAIDTDIAGLVDIYAGQGREGLILRLKERLDVAPAISETPYYRLTDSRQQVLVANLPALPAINPGASPTFSMRLSDPPVAVQLRATRLRDGLILAVGRSEERLEASLAQLQLMFGGALLVMVSAAFVIGGLASLSLRRRISAINTLFENLIGPSPVAVNGSFKGDEVSYLETNIRDAATRIERLLSAQRDISDHVAHEMRTPLMLLENRLRLAMGNVVSPDVLASLQAASDQTHSLLQLLDALLDIASAEAQRGDLKGLGDISLSEVSRSICELYAASAEEAGLKLICEIEDDVTMRADAMQISRLLVNLLDNAFKYGASGEFIRLKVSSGPAIEIEDDGPGVAKADRIRIFERYGRGGADHSRRGHGLGLALTRAIAARYGLGLRLEDGTSGGARFIVAPEATDLNVTGKTS